MGCWGDGSDENDHTHDDLSSKLGVCVPMKFRRRLRGGKWRDTEREGPVAVL